MKNADGRFTCSTNYVEFSLISSLLSCVFYLLAWRIKERCNRQLLFLCTVLYNRVPGGSLADCSDVMGLIRHWSLCRAMATQQPTTVELILIRGVRA